jgi:hypothetical protein
MFPRFAHLTSRLFDQSTKLLPVACCPLFSAPSALGGSALCGYSAFHIPHSAFDLPLACCSARSILHCRLSVCHVPFRPLPAVFSSLGSRR